MYTSSSAKIKLLNKLSEKIDVLCGTEQGHPMSPELFKCFVHELSENLNNMDAASVPLLNNERITHLLWADDLVLLSLNAETLQRMLGVLQEYCTDWGLSVNLSKTAVMIFNRAGRLLKESHNFLFGSSPIPTAREYTYLGITFSLTGSMKLAQTKLRQRALRSYFSLKSMIDLNHLKKTAVFSLFDSLVVPVLSYGCQVWLPMTNFMKAKSNGSFPTGREIAEDPLEKVHLTFLKWSLNVNKYTSNNAVWGDTRRYPLAIELSSRVFGYLERLENLSNGNTASFVQHAFAEQKDLNLTWYDRLHTMRCELSKESTTSPLSPRELRQALRESFVEQWNHERLANKKLSFYNTIKEEFGCENYLCTELTYEQLRRLAQFRTSSHQYRVETGRHGDKRSNILNRVCNHCSTADSKTLNCLAALPEFDPIIEDELHVLETCGNYDDLRKMMSQNSMDLLLNGKFNTLFTETKHIKAVAKLLTRIHKRRFPEKNHFPQGG